MNKSLGIPTSKNRSENSQNNRTLISTKEILSGRMSLKNIIVTYIYSSLNDGNIPYSNTFTSKLQIILKQKKRTARIVFKQNTLKLSKLKSY